MDSTGDLALVMLIQDLSSKDVYAGILTGAQIRKLQNGEDAEWVLAPKEQFVKVFKSGTPLPAEQDGTLKLNIINMIPLSVK